MDALSKFVSLQTEIQTNGVMQTTKGLIPSDQWVMGDLVATTAEMGFQRKIEKKGVWFVQMSIGYTDRPLMEYFGITEAQFLKV